MGKFGEAQKADENHIFNLSLFGVGVYEFVSGLDVGFFVCSSSGNLGLRINFACKN